MQRSRISTRRGRSGVRWRGARRLEGIVVGEEPPRAYILLPSPSSPTAAAAASQSRRVGILAQMRRRRTTSSSRSGGLGGVMGLAVIQHHIERRRLSTSSGSNDIVDPIQTVVDVIEWKVRAFRLEFFKVLGGHKKERILFPRSEPTATTTTTTSQTCFKCIVVLAIWATWVTVARGRVGICRRRVRKAYGRIGVVVGVEQVLQHHSAALATLILVISRALPLPLRLSFSIGCCDDLRPQLFDAVGKGTVLPVLTALRFVDIGAQQRLQL